MKISAPEPIGVKLASMMEAPPNIFIGDGRIEFSGNREVFVDGYKGMQEYSEEIVRVSLGKLSVKFFGRGLSIKYMSGECLIIQGFIVKMEFLT